MKKIKKGDIVGRLSYNKDIIFIVERIIKCSSGKEIAILKGINIRIQADSDIDDLELIEKKEAAESEEKINKRFESKIKNYEKLIDNNQIDKRTKKVIYTGRILHLDGDKRYSEKSNLFYKKMGLKAIVRNIPENRQANIVNQLIDRYYPDILVITRT